jgi:DNA-binding response OmpR family regulator
MTFEILVVDDDPDIREVAGIILETQDYKVLTATNGVEALAMLRQEKPDLMILDLLMPKMDGFAVCKELQDSRWSRFHDMPIMILTSVQQEASRRRYELETGLEMEVADFIEKPLVPDVLIKRVAKLIK